MNVKGMCVPEDLQNIRVPLRRVSRARDLSVFRNFQIGNAVAQLVEAMRYKPEGRGFDSRWHHWSFSMTRSFRPQYSPGVDLASKRNNYQEYFLGG